MGCNNNKRQSRAGWSWLLPPRLSACRRGVGSLAPVTSRQGEGFQVMARLSRIEGFYRGLELLLLRALSFYLAGFRGWLQEHANGQQWLARLLLGSLSRS